MPAPSADTREFDSFGPWVDEVRSPEEVPRLYRDHPLDLATARLVLKVPRDIARRDATPDMDLYDHVLVVRQERLTVLSRDGAVTAPLPAARRHPGYHEHDIPVADIAAVSQVVNFLDGWLVIHSRSGDTLRIRFNGSAHTSIDRLVHALTTETDAAAPGVLGERLLGARPQPGTPSAADLGRQDVALVSDYGDAARRGADLTALAWHGRQVVAPRGSGALGLARRALHATSPMTLHGAVLARTSRTLEVFTRHEGLIRGKKPVHSSRHIVVPLARLEALTSTPHPRYAEVSTVDLALGAEHLTLAVPTDSFAHRLLVTVALDGSV